MQISGVSATADKPTEGMRLDDVAKERHLAPYDTAVALLKANVAPPTPLELAAGDLNGNGRLDVGDVPLLLRLIAGQPMNP